MAYSPTQLPELLTCVNRIFLALEHDVSPFKKEKKNIFKSVIGCFVGVLHVHGEGGGGGGDLSNGFILEREKKVLR